jgi:glycosyltransferase involved in cell wall biosynthesis
MTLSVICPIYNEEKYIARCIESIMRQDYPKEDLEVLFVDGMSTDRTREIIASYLPQCPYLRVLDNPQRIVPPAMNIGICEAKGEIIIRLDAHAIFPENYFSELVANLSSLDAENVGGVCRTLPVNDSPVCVGIANVLSSSFGMGNSYFRVGAKEVMQVDTVPFGCFHREIFDKIGYFDEELIRNQDDEFNGRIIKNGGKIFLLPHLVIDYYARDTIKKVYKMFYQYGLFKPLVNKKLGSPATIRQFFPLLFVLGLLLGPFTFFISRWFMVAYFAVILLYFGLATLFSLKDSHNLKQVTIQDWIYFVVHFGYGWGYLVGLFKLLFKSSFAVNVNR